MCDFGFKRFCTGIRHVSKMWVLGCLVPSSGLVMSSCHTYNTPSNIIRTPTLDLCHNVNPHPHINTQEVSISAQNGHEHITLRNKRWGSRALTPKLHYTNTVVQHISNNVANIVGNMLPTCCRRCTTCPYPVHHQRTRSQQFYMLATISPPTDKILPPCNIWTCRDVGLCQSPTML